MKRWVLLPLCVVIFLDTFGGFFTSPLVNALFYNTQTGVVVGHVPMAMRNFLYGASTAIFLILMCVFSPVMGSLSDSIGRRKTLLLCLTGSLGGYVLTLFSIFSHNIVLFIIGRVIDGISGGSMPVAQAAIIDVSHAERKAVNMSYLTLAMSLGIMLGPVIGGVLSDSSIIPQFNVITPFYFATGLTLFNLLLLAIQYKEKWQKSSVRQLALFSSFKRYRSIIANQRLFRLLIIFMVMQLGWGCFFQFLAVYLHHFFNFTSTAIGIYIGMMGVASVFAMGVLIKPLLAKMSASQVTLLALLCIAICTLLFVLANHQWMLWVLVGPMSMGIILGYSLMNTLISDCVGQHQQGWVMGVTSSMGSLAFGVASLSDGFIADFGLKVPIFAAVVFTLLAITLKTFRLPQGDKVVATLS